MNFIDYWAKLVVESQHEDNIDENMRSMARPESRWGRGRIGMARPDELGRKIMHLFSPANFRETQKGEESPYFNSGFNCFMTDKVGILRRYPKVSNVDRLGDGLIAFFSCTEGTLTPRLIVDAFNDWCSEVLPREYSEDDVVFLGTHDISGKKTQDGRKGDLYAINLTKKLSGGSVDKNSIESRFDDAANVFSDCDVSMQIGKKADFEKYFRRNREGIERLDGASSYMAFFCLGGLMDADDVLKLANDVNKSGEEDSLGLAAHGSFLGRDVVYLGRMRKKSQKTQNFEDFDVYAVRLAVKDVK